MRSSAMCAAVMDCLRSSSSCGIAHRKRRRARGPDAPAALVKLVKDALARNVSFATRGNLIILAPPLVIEEKELQDALSLLDGLLGEMKL